jgi:formylglycine-generating enzyme required for sulfatase activity
MTMGDGRNARNWVVAVDESGRRREFDLAELPLSFGAVGADVGLPGVPGTLQIGKLGETFFLQIGRGTRNVRVNGQTVAGSSELRDGDVVAIDRVRLACRVEGGALTVGVQLQVTAGDTAPPDLEEVARTRETAGAVTITPIAFKPTAQVATGSRRAPRPATIGVAAAVAVAAVIAWFTFTAKSIQLNIDPAPARVSVPGTFFKLRLGERYLLRPGTHRVAAELAGYYPLDASIEVSDKSAEQAFPLAFTKLPGKITLTTEPEAKAQVLVDGAMLGVTPLADAELTPGLHRIEFRADRYLAEVRELEVSGGGERQQLAAKLTPNWAPVRLRTEPPGATVMVDGAAAGATPATLELPAGERSLEVRLAGFNAWNGKVQVVANQPLELPDVKLAPADGRVEIASAPSEASISIDGEFRGRTPLQLKLAPGRAHKLTLTKPGYETVTNELSVAADSGRRLMLELTPQYGAVEVVSTPANAAIVVDGQQKGVTPATLQLTAVSHVIEIQQPGYAPERVELMPRPGFPQKVERALVALDTSSGGGFPSTLRTAMGQDLKLVPAGQFTMGSSRREAGRRSNEVLRPVRVTHAFYLGAREVTNAEFRKFKPEHSSGSFGGLSLNDDAQPVANVTWDEAVQYMNWLSIKDGLQPVYEERAGGWAPVRPLRSGYRLPTEAEWEWAARFAGQQTGLLYAWGADLPPPERAGNYADLAAAKILQTTLITYNDGFPVSAPVGTFAANAYGLHDLGGNVSEWIQDYYSLDSVDSTQRVDDPLGPEVGRFHGVRGASWRSATLTDLRVAARSYEANARDDLGFRIARNLQ